MKKVTHFRALSALNPLPSTLKPCRALAITYRFYDILGHLTEGYLPAKVDMLT